MLCVSVHVCCVLHVSVVCVHVHGERMGCIILNMCESRWASGSGISIGGVRPWRELYGTPKGIASGTPDQDIRFHLVPRGEVGAVPSHRLPESTVILKADTCRV